jgi:hypothetical protein
MLAVPAAAQAPPLTSIWQRVLYPPVTIPGTREQLTFVVSSGGHRTGPTEEPSHLRFDIRWGARAGLPLPPAISSESGVVVRVHAGDGKVLTPRQSHWVAVGSGGGALWYLTYTLPWSRNALDEAWFEVRIANQSWWVELPYGFARNPEDPELPDRDRDVPRFLTGMLPLGANDLLVPWLAAEYEIGRAGNGALLSLKVSNPFTARVSVVLYREPPMQLGPDRSRQNLDKPRVGVKLEAPGRRFAGRELARRLSDDRHTRTDDFDFAPVTGLPTGRAFGTLIISIDHRRYAVRVPSSLFAFVHGRTDPQNSHWMAESR